jgi:hypothetical protein
MSPPKCPKSVERYEDEFYGESVSSPEFVLVCSLLGLLFGIVIVLALYFGLELWLISARLDLA